MSKVGYIRISSKDQNIDRQIQLFKNKYEVEKIPKKEHRNNNYYMIWYIVTCRVSL